MKKIRKILVGIDASACSAEALREAIRLAEFEEAEILGVTIFDRDEVESLSKRTQMAADTIIAAETERFNSFVNKTVGAPSHLRLEARLGHPFGGLMELCRTYRPDLLVLGRTGERETEIQGAGTLASKCVRSASCEVLIVDAKASGPYQHVLAAVDFSEGARRALAEAALFCRCHGAQLHVVHIDSHHWIRFMESGVLSEKLKKTADEQAQEVDLWLSRFLTEAEEFIGDLLVKSATITRATPVAGIQEYVRDAGIDLVVIGTRGRTPTEVQIIGSTAEQIVYGTSCSVLTVQPEGIAAANHRM